MMVGDPQGEVIVQITTCSNIYYNCLFTSSASRIDYLYNPIFGIGESGKNCISLSTSLSGGIPLGSYNTPPYDWNNDLGGYSHSNGPNFYQRCSHDEELVEIFPT